MSKAHETRAEQLLKELQEVMLQAKAEKPAWNLPRQIEVEIRESYGTRKAYPVNTTAVVFSQIAGTKTLTGSTLKLISKLGYDFFEVYPDPSGQGRHHIQSSARLIANSIGD